MAVVLPETTLEHVPLVLVVAVDETRIAPAGSRQDVVAIGIPQEPKATSRRIARRLVERAEGVEEIEIELAVVVGVTLHASVQSIPTVPVMALHDAGVPEYSHGSRIASCDTRYVVGAPLT